MCGIAGIINRNKQAVGIGALKTLTDPIAHRGPDGEGHYLYDNMGFGHRRLAIIDLTSAGHQPMEKDGLTITYNGEIYNYLELRKELEELGYSFTTHTDTEVILKAYAAWGTECVERFNGMWAFAILNKNEKKIFLSRDRFGIKPCYYYEGENEFVFGSEIKQILPFLKTREVNRQALYDFLYLSYQDHNDNTFFKGIKMLLPGHNMQIDLDDVSVSISKYYELRKINVDDIKDIDGAIAKYQESFEKSIDFRLRSDVKVGTCLSGGLDSSYVAQVASEKYKGEEAFTAITAKSMDSTNDESEYARKVAEACSLNWKVTKPSQYDFQKFTESIIYNQEEPFTTPSIFMQFFVMQAAKSEGCVVMLDGQGGDETLLGYERYFVPYLKSIKNPIKFIREFYLLIKNSKLSLRQLLLYYLYFGSSRVKAQSILRNNRYILKENQKYIDQTLSGAFEKASKDLFELQKLELTSLQLPKLLKFEDRNSMAHSIEARVPFVDHKLIELAVSLPQDYKIHRGWSKYVLRRSFGINGLEAIVWRKNKLGFEAPTRKWMENKSFFVKAIRDSKFMDSVIDKNYALENLNENKIWKLYNITKWAELFDVKY